MRSIIVAFMLAGVALAGCIGGGDPAGTDAANPLEPVAGQPMHIFNALQEPLDAAAFGGDLPSFDMPFVSSRISGEPTIAVTRSSAVFYPAIDFDGPGGLPLTEFYRSTDGGTTWTDVTPAAAGMVRSHPYTFDPYVYADPTTGRVFALDMGPNFNCNHVSISDDDGESWITQYFTCPVPVVDHPSIFAGPSPNPVGLPYPNMVYLCTNALAMAHCVVSADGGLAWAESTPVFTECGGLTGHGHAARADGTVYLPRVGCGVPQVGISRDFGATWQTVDVAPSGGNGHEAIVATDSAGTAYIVWLGDDSRAIFLSVSKDQGTTWSDPINVTAPGVTAVKLPSITAGADGRIAFLYVGTTTPSGWAVHEENDDGTLVRPDEYANATWNAYIGVSLNADSDDPVFATTTAHPLEQPLKRGGCEGRCFGDEGGMYDFFDIEIDPMTGQVWAALVDVCTDECDEPGADADSHQQADGVVARQTGGTYLLDQPIAEA